MKELLDISQQYYDETDLDWCEDGGQGHRRGDARHARASPAQNRNPRLDSISQALSGGS